MVQYKILRVYCPRRSWSWDTVSEKGFIVRGHVAAHQPPSSAARHSLLLMSQPFAVMAFVIAVDNADGSDEARIYYDVY